MKSSWPRPRACVPAKGAHWSRFLAIRWPGGAKPAEVGPLVLNKAAPSAARYRPAEGTGRWERPHCTRHSPAHPQGQCFCPLACALLQFIPGRLGDLGWDHWFQAEVVTQWAPPTGGASCRTAKSPCRKAMSGNANLPDWTHSFLAADNPHDEREALAQGARRLVG